MNYRNLLHSGEAQVLLAEDDFDGDGFIDHAGVTEEDTFEPYMGTVTEKTVRIYSGNVAGGSEPVILNETVISRTHSYFYGETVLTEEEKYMPCASIGDTDGDGASELAIGLEAPTSMYSGDKGSSVIYVNLNKGIKTEYIFDPYISLFSSYPFGGATEIQKDCYERMANVGSLPQKSNLVFVERSKYKKGDYFGYSAYPVSEILDLISHQTVLQLQVDVDSIDALPDLTGDGINEYLISSGGILYCYNSEFKVTFSNLLEGEIKTTNTFTVEWSSPALQPMYQLIVNNTAQVLTSSTSDLVSLGSGWKHIQVLLYDTAGIFVSVDDVTIFIPESNTMIIVTVIIVVGLVVVQILRKKRKASIKRKYDIVADKSSSTTAPQYQTNGKAGERSWNPKG